jgi:hypothetical protein
MNMPKRAGGLNPSMVMVVAPAFNLDRFLETVEAPSSNRLRNSPLKDSQ